MATLYDSRGRDFGFGEQESVWTAGAGRNITKPRGGPLTFREFFGNKVKSPEPPPTEAELAAAAAAAESERLRNRKGWRSTILTGFEGITDDAFLKKTKLG